MSVSYLLQRVSLNNVADVAGLWQHEGGNVLQDGKQVGYYASYKRVTNGGTTAENTAMLTLTIFFNKLLGTTAPENITVQGSHDFNSGNEIGSVSAASAGHHAMIAQNFSRNGATNIATIG